jgi:gamma-glutamylcyclotransferase (GGCT)/AIG2-like uncharacterized protein YtfP
MFLIEFDTRHDAPKVYYFAYGLLTDPRIMRGAELIGRGELKNHRLEFRGFANVTESPGDTVYGALWQLPDGFLSHLDQIEGYPEMYDRRTVPVLCDGKKYTAEVYKMTPHYQEYFGARREPKLDYLSRLARGYIHVGVPNQQLHQAVQELDNQELAEVAMNPSAYAQSMSQAADAGVLVGYEFEVCVPQESMDVRSGILSTTELLDAVFAEITSDEPWNFDSSTFDSMFKLVKGRRFRVPGMLNRNFFDMGSAVTATMQDYPEPQDDDDDEYVPETVYIKEILDYNDLLDHQAFSEAFNIDRKFAHDWLEYYYEEQGETGSNYAETAQILKSDIEEHFGVGVRVFQKYHQQPKNLTDWYVEPDGSLEPNSGDGAAEIVTPPMPAPQAAQVLRQFYDLARARGLYTNDSTGLHINVSVPQKLDVLKLAVFLGDKYVLGQFQRLDSEYAKSVERRLEKAATGLSSINPEVFDIKEAPAYLQRLAQNATKDHMASISNNGQYISFRHAGGDYLAHYEKISQTLGRFVRAMLIAADPQAHVNEYRKKLHQLMAPALDQAEKHGTPATMKTLQVIRDIRSHGVPVLQVDIIISSYNTPSTGYLPASIHGMYTGNHAIGVKLTRVRNAQPLVFAEFQKDRPELFKRIQDYYSDGITGFRYQLTPNDLTAVEKLIEYVRKIETDPPNPRQYLITLQRLPLTDRKAQQLMQHIKQVLGQIKSP